MPLMTKKQGEELLKIIDDVLELPPEKNIFKHNINPLRLSLLLYKIVDDVSAKFNFSQYIANTLKDHITDQIVRVLEIYKEVQEMDLITEITDLEGRNCFWYFRRYPLYKVLSTKILDKYMSSKWSGNDDITCSITDYSSSYTMLTITKPVKPNEIIQDLKSVVFDC